MYWVGWRSGGYANEFAIYESPPNLRAAGAGCGRGPWARRVLAHGLDGSARRAAPPGRVGALWLLIRPTFLGTNRRTRLTTISKRRNNRSEEHTSELQSRQYLVRRLPL